ncbi:MAG TPA: ABC transporter permease, partial [bacterium]|nr:ABC transporter permease [bacterium]
MIEGIFSLELLFSALRMSVPLVFASLGGVYSERGGVVNIALEGIMLMGAFGAVVGTYFTN